MATTLAHPFRLSPDGSIAVLAAGRPLTMGVQ